MTVLSLTEVQELSKLKSATNGTSLVTLIVPALTSMALVCKKLTEELSTAPNIKSKSVRTDVISALKSALVTVRAYTHTSGENGLVLIAGVPSTHT